MTTVRMAHSAHSDDAFMLHGLASGAVTSSGLSFVHEVADLESLNHEAVEARYEITALSVHAYAYLQRQYLLLDSGASFGDGYGPIVVVPQGSQLRDLNELTGKRIAVPGKWTSATLALAIRLPLHTQVPMGFEQVGGAVKRGEVDAGLLIHEGQLTPGGEGLAVLEDLGAWWKERTGLPLPLGVNAVKRDLPEPLRAKLARVMAESVAYGLDHRDAALDHAMGFARGLDRGQADRFVGMYVNGWTRSAGLKGRKAVALFLGEAAQRGLIPRVKPEYQEY